MTLCEVFEQNEILKKEIDNRLASNMTKELQEKLPNETVKVLELVNCDYHFRVNFSFIIDNYLQDDKE